MLDKLKKEIESTLKEEQRKNTIRGWDYDYSKSIQTRISELDKCVVGDDEWKKHQGWIEALEYVMGQIDHFSKEESKNDFTGACPKCGSDENLEAGNGSSWGEYDYDCHDCGHSFTIESKGWEIS